MTTPLPSGGVEAFLPSKDDPMVLSRSVADIAATVVEAAGRSARK